MSGYYVRHNFHTYKAYSTDDITSGEPMYIDHYWDHVDHKWLTYYNWYKFDDLWMMINTYDAMYFQDNTGHYIIPGCRKL